MLSIFIGPTDLRWRAILERAKHDVYHLPEYITLCGKYEDSEPLAFFAEDGEAACLIPVLLKRIPGHLDAPSAWCDLASPYGYPAPLYTHPQNSELIGVFLNAFRCAADKLCACSVFLRLHPLFGGPVGVRMPFSACLRHGETVSIDLTRPEDELWRQTRPDHRRGIRRLEELNFAPLMDDWSLYGEFARMYRQTMVRLGADEYYHFSDDYFGDLKASLGDKLHLCSVVSPEGRLAASGLYTTVDGVIEGHLAGSDPSYYRLAPTKLMQHFVGLWGKQRGCRVLHLGGGVGAQRDSLFEFKAGFSPDRHEFWTLRMIPNKRRYAALTLRAGLPLNPGADLEGEYFPPYRRCPIRLSCLTSRDLTAATFRAL
jgi:hypothetical protein